MTAHSATVAVHATNDGSTVDVVTLDENYGAVDVLNRSASATLWVRPDSDGVDPVAGADDNFVVPPGQSAQIGMPEGTTVIRVLADASCDYSVTGS